MPESRSRRRTEYTPPRRAVPADKLHSPVWLVPTMVTLMLLGLAWIVVFYLAGNEVPGISTLGNWNILIGMGLIAVGFLLTTQWR